MGLSRRTLLRGGTGLAAVGVVTPKAAEAAGPAEYYVDSLRGSDLNKGSDNHPFATLTKAVEVMRAGDVLNLRRGSVFRTPLNLTGKAAGTIVRAYGPGPDPVIDLLADGLGAPSDWTQDGTENRWSRTLPVPPGGWSGFLLVPNGQAGNYHKPNPAAVLAPGDYHFTVATSTLFVHSVGNPTTSYQSLQYVPQSLGARNDIGLLMAAPDDPREAAAAAGLTVRNLVVRGARRNIQLAAGATLIDVTAQFAASTNIQLSWGGTYRLTRVRSLDCGSTLVSGEHCLLVAGNGSTNVRGVAADWTGEGGNVWSRSLAALGSPAGNHLIRDWMDFPSRRYVGPRATLSEVDSAEGWFVDGDKLYVFATGNPATVYTALLGGRYERMDVLLTDCELDYAGDDVLQVGGNTHPDSHVRVVGTAPGRSRLSRGAANSVDIKSATVSFTDTWIWQNSNAAANKLGPAITIQGSSRDISFEGCAVSNLLTNKQALYVQEMAPRIESERTMWYGKNQSGNGVMVSNYNGRSHSFSFDLFYNDSGIAQGLPVVGISGDHSFTHCGFHASSSSSTVRSMMFRGNSTQAAACKAITVGSTVVVDGTEYVEATIQWDGTEVYLGPGARFLFGGLAGASAALNGVWTVRDSWYAINGASNTRSFSTFLVPASAAPPAQADLAGLTMRFWGRLNRLRGCVLAGKTEVVRLDADLGVQGATFPIDWDDMVPAPLDANYWAQRGSSNQRLVTAVYDGVQRHYTAAQVLSDDAAVPGNLIADSHSKWGGSANRVETNLADVQDAYLEPPVAALTVADGIATVACPGHGLSPGNKVIITGVTAPLSGLEGAFFVETVVDGDTFTYRAARGTPEGAAALAGARVVTGRLKPTSAGHGAAPAYDVPFGQLDLQGNPVPQSGRSFGPVVAG
ncbi:MAG TPA: hypothetical protein VF062_15655 [Candidatus Limnocylindrales bacterium]